MSSSLEAERHRGENTHTPSQSQLNTQPYLCWKTEIECVLSGHTSPTHPEYHTHTHTYQGRSSTLHCLRICEWKNGLTHLAERQDASYAEDRLSVCLSRHLTACMSHRLIFPSVDLFSFLCLLVCLNVNF